MAELFGLLRDDKIKKYVWIDCETQNLCLNECHNLPWQISMITYSGNSPKKEHDFYIKWPQGIKVSKGAAIVTGYNPEIVDQFGLPPEDVLDAVQNEIESCDIVAGHNLLGFDTYLIQSLYKKLGRKPYNIVPKVLDTLAIARGIKLGIPYNRKEDFSAWQYRLIHKRTRKIKCNLGALGKEFGIEHDYNSLHNAISDIQLNIKVWDKLKWMMEI